MWPFKRKATQSTQSAYDFSFTSLTGQKPLSLADYMGKVLLVVNTASRCGFTNQYAGLEKLYQDYAARGLVIIGVPSDDFGHQEPGSNDEISSFCQINYGVTFPMTAKETVVGNKSHAFYQWAGSISLAPKWNFHKYLINRQGQLADCFISTTEPHSKKLIEAIETLLAASA